LASYTPNYNLKKPAPTDFYNIADHNANMDSVDTALHGLQSQISNIHITPAELRVHVAVDTLSPITVTVSNGTVMTQTVNASAEWAIFPIDELGDWEVTVQYGTSTYTQKVAVENIGIHYANPVPLAQLSWDRIIWVARAGLAPRLFKSGDSHGPGEGFISSRIIGFNHDDLADGSGKAPIAFQATDVDIYRNYMNSTNTNTGGWQSSAIRQDLNNSIINYIDPDLKSAIKNVNKRTVNGTNNGSSITSDKLFLLSEMEYAGGYTLGHADEGRQYAYYAAGNQKTAMKGSQAVNQWFRSKSRHDNQSFVATDLLGTPMVQTANSIHSGIFAFCIG